MSKHKGNVVDPWAVLDKQGADAVRWYFYVGSAPWLPSRFYDDAVSEAQRKFMGTLWNTYAFYILYADIDDFDPTQHTLSGHNVMDKWILSRLHTLVKTVGRHLDNYRITEPARELDNFVDELSNWYVRRCRGRFWAAGMEEDKVDAFLTLYTVLETLCRLAAPFIPFMTETMYQNLVRSVDKNAPESVHLTAFPTADDKFIDKALEEGMDAVLKVVVLGRSARNTAVIKNRQPIANMYVGGIDDPGDMFTELIAGELNVKKVSFGADVTQYIAYSIKPQMRTLGPKYGKLLNVIREHLAAGDGIAIVNAVRGGGTYSFDASGTEVILSEEDLLIEPKQKEGYVVESDGGVSAILETTLTDELIEEGFVRELISKIQTMRKEAGFEVMDHIRFALSGNDRLEGVVARNAEEIGSEVLADEISDTLSGYEKEWDINGEKAMMSVKKLG
jgi:isoleucyl-tRNA synthetase